MSTKDFDYYSTNDAGKELGITKQAVHNLINTGKLQYKLTSSGRYLLDVDEVELLKIAREASKG